MKNINKDTIQQDKETLAYMISKYNDAVWERQEGQPAHFDNQPKIVQLVMRDVVVGLNVALEAIKKLDEIGVIEDD